MSGHGYAPQQPPPPAGGSPVTLRVMFVVLAVVTCGLLAWAPLLRLAIVTRKAYDWVVFAVVTALDVTGLVLIGVDPGEEEFQGPGNAGMIVLLCTLMAAVAYYLFADIRHFSRLRQPAFTAYAPPPAPPAYYGYPAAPPPVQETPPAPPAPARIHQVRAELDELSDYLRKQQGGN
ncbi:MULTISPECIES: hypothetical protein [unclassified Streptomyces]|uniref:hypothetical protein n=1 Tax=unclassified Streptomyces TaxID=2593676 RepID=UPI001CBFE6B5|nr:MULTISPECIES: hypothetical protein [unclassified Streptomyces]WPO73299.1 hypothetical protein R9806_23040 [Streptomyces sp. KN37]